MNTSETITRRRFISHVALAGTVVAASPLFNLRAQGSPKKFRVGVVGCGGRGSGAMENILEAGKSAGVDIEIYSVADFFADRANGAAQKYNIPKERTFFGPSAYHEVMAQPVEIIILATPPVFRPTHLEAALQAGKHCFIEKPVAVDPAGARKIIALGELAKSKGLSIVAGTQRRHMSGYLRNQFAVEHGAIGKITGGVVSWCGGKLWFKTREPNEDDASYLVRNWTSFTEMSGDHIVEQHVHNLDVANWFIGRTPQSAIGFGGRARRQTGDQFDFFSIDLNYGDDCHIHSMCRQVNGCYENVGENFIGTEGSCYGSGKINSSKLAGIQIPEFKTHDNGQVQEHIDLLQGILAGQPLNGARQVAEATLTAIMGRIACYTGQMIRWSDLTTNTASPWYNLALSPNPADFEAGKVIAPKDNVWSVPGEA